ncbi:MAG TPA: prepilin-type N-terminal cleavage/methylation domain-containing protein [Candidatus Acidoferrales bacterium]|nr:prepilin-type N-terminal cleavage/methylation domain-containing protein [Candidatus Acidoferrales bacterium]
MKNFPKIRAASTSQRGFTLIELAVATIVLMVGVVAVVQLVPFATQTNQANRVDTTAVVIAQHYLDEMTAQPLANITINDPACGAMSLGTGAAGTSVMYPSAGYLTMYNGTATVDFTQAAAGGYNCAYSDPNNPSGGTYKLRWGVVVTQNAAGQVVSKRYVVGVKQSAMQFRLPVDLDATVQR